MATGLFVRRIDFRRACIQRAALRGGDLRYARLQLCRAEGVDLRQANLSGADLYLSSLEASLLGGAVLAGANLCGAVLLSADYDEDLRLFSEELDTAFGDAFTILPKGVRRPVHWAKNLHRWQDVYRSWTSWRIGRGLETGGIM